MDLFHPLDGLGNAPGVILILLIALAFVVFMIFIGIPLLVFLFETLLLVPIALIVGVAGRVLLGRPWTLEASTPGPPPARTVWRVVGWAASGRGLDRMAAAIRSRGQVPEHVPETLPRAHRH